jgi:hypothetical protein
MAARNEIVPLAPRPAAAAQRSLQRIATQREMVLAYYTAAEKANSIKCENGDPRATKEYIWPNQKYDANNIVELFYSHNKLVVAVKKKTKVGADGLMIEISKLMTTHNDDSFVIDPDCVRILTGMSNVSWQVDMKEKAPNCFEDKIFHHGQLQNANLQNLRNGLLIIDEMDTATKEGQKLHKELEAAGVLDINFLRDNNIRLVFISATPFKQMISLFQWGDLSAVYEMTIPDEYFGHKDFMMRNLLQEFYPIRNLADAMRWCQEDILQYYGNDFRVHFHRVNARSREFIRDACIALGIHCRDHTSTDRLTEKDIDELFNKDKPLTAHKVILVKNLFRRANLWPNDWKVRIGATHELHTKIVDYNVQVQGFPGRLSGYWRDIIESGHKTGPHRTSLKAMQEYEKAYHDLFSASYQGDGFKLNNGKVSVSTPTMLDPHNIKNLQAVPLPAVPEEVVDINTYRIYSENTDVSVVCKKLGYKSHKKPKLNAEGFWITSHHGEARVMSLAEAVKLVPKTYGLEKKDGEKEGRGRRTYLPCYVDTADKTTLRFVVIVHPDVDKARVEKVDAEHPSIPYAVGGV